mgnify:CR=1 FL=1
MTVSITKDDENVVRNFSSANGAAKATHYSDLVNIIPE